MASTTPPIQFFPLKKNEKSMKKLLILTATIALFSTSAMAGGSHSGGHGRSHAKSHVEGHAGGHGHATAGEHANMMVGEPGRASKVSRTIKVEMRETDDGDMIFKPSRIQVGRGETIIFMISNKGELAHEFVLDEHKAVMKHKALMERFPEMEHEDPNSIRLESGKKGQIIWRFTNSGKFEFACLVPGHYDAGMKGIVAVVNKVASN